MARRSRQELAEIGEQIKSYLAWHNAREGKYGNAAELAKAKFGYRFARRIAATESFLESTENAATRIAGRKASRTIAAKDVPSQAYKPSILRVTIRGTFDNPRTGKRQKFVATEDFQFGRTYQSILDTSRGKLIADLMGKYGIRSGAQGRFASRFKSFKITAIEGV